MAVGFKQQASPFGIFGNPLMPNKQPFGQPMPPQGPQMPQPKKGGGFFGQGGAGRGIAGAIGDYLLQMSGAQPIYAPEMQYRRQLQDTMRMQEAERAAKRADKMEDRAYDASKPGTMEKNFSFWKDLPEDLKPLFAEYYDTIQPDFVQGADGQSYQRSRTGLPPGYDPNEWEAVPGPEGGAGPGQPGFP